MVGQEEAGWQVEGMENFGRNVVSFMLTFMAQRWYVVGVYVPPNNVPAVHRVDQALVTKTKGLETILVGYLNVRLGELQDNQ